MTARAWFRISLTVGVLAAASAIAMLACLGTSIWTDGELSERLWATGGLFFGVSFVLTMGSVLTGFLAAEL